MHRTGFNRATIRNGLGAFHHQRTTLRTHIPGRLRAHSIFALRVLRTTPKWSEATLALYNSTLFAQ